MWGSVRPRGFPQLKGYVCSEWLRGSAAHKSNKSNPWSNLIYLILLDTGFVVWDIYSNISNVPNLGVVLLRCYFRPPCGAPRMISSADCTYQEPHKPQLENGQKKPLDYDRFSSTSICLPIRKHGTLRYWTPRLAVLSTQNPRTGEPSWLERDRYESSFLLIAVGFNLTKS